MFKNYNFKAFFLDKLVTKIHCWNIIQSIRSVPPIELLISTSECSEMYIRILDSDPSHELLKFVENAL